MACGVFLSSRPARSFAPEARSPSRNARPLAPTVICFAPPLKSLAAAAQRCASKAPDFGPRGFLLRGQSRKPCAPSGKPALRTKKPRTQGEWQRRARPGASRGEDGALQGKQPARVDRAGVVGLKSDLQVRALRHRQPPIRPCTSDFRPTAPVELATACRAEIRPTGSCLTANHQSHPVGRTSVRHHGNPNDGFLPYGTTTASRRSSVMPSGVTVAPRAMTSTPAARASRRAWP